MYPVTKRLHPSPQLLSRKGEETESAPRRLVLNAVKPSRTVDETLGFAVLSPAYVVSLLPGEKVERSAG